MVRGPGACRNVKLLGEIRQSRLVLFFQSYGIRSIHLDALHYIKKYARKQTFGCSEAWVVTVRALSAAIVIAALNLHLVHTSSVNTLPPAFARH